MRTILTRSTAIFAILTLVIAGAAPVSAASRRYVALSVGYQHNCALTAQGKAYCWGYNNYGQLGTGDTNNAMVAVPVIGGLKFTSISAGSVHTCAITTKGKAYCWGSNGYFMLGVSNDSIDRLSPTAVEVVSDVKFASITAGDQHTCALTAKGRAYCWGNNGDGRLGVGETDGVRVVGGLKFASIDAGYRHTCALTAQGRAYCWGDNELGELGTGDNADSLTPVAVVGGLKFTALSVGSDYTSALTKGGEPYGWGDNSNGQLGTGNVTSYNLPVVAMGGIRFTSVGQDAPYSHSKCFGLASGRLRCVGSSSYILFGDVGYIDTPVTVAVRGVVYGAGEYHICALTAAGKVLCWGRNDHGQLGSGSWDDSSTPVAVR
jgi:alpha-tubulin suppressor-like RCC1 family protein